mmetsp:Transcript_12419/g.33359  ORF Transcript_12419/g.33359 Transcript_12419/m.33359 type:complete len:226 (-) Transcript_12419:253-930(-)
MPSDDWCRGALPSSRCSRPRDSRPQAPHRRCWLGLALVLRLRPRRVLRSTRFVGCLRCQQRRRPRRPRTRWSTSAANSGPSSWTPRARPCRVSLPSSQSALRPRGCLEAEPTPRRSRSGSAGSSRASCSTSRRPGSRRTSSPSAPPPPPARWLPARARPLPWRRPSCAFSVCTCRPIALQMSRRTPATSRHWSAGIRRRQTCGCRMLRSRARFSAPASSPSRRRV